MYLNKIIDNLKKNRKELKVSIPGIWNYRGGKIYNKSVSVNIIEWMKNIIEKEISINRVKGIDYLSPIKNHKTDFQGDWIKSCRLMYGITMRFFSAYDFNNDGLLSDSEIKETGTILRSIALLPYLKSMGVDVIYLTPIMKYSDKYKKGTLGSIYATEDFYKVDPNLGDPVLEDMTVEEEMKAFVEACHILGIRVLFDFVPRTTARGNETLISEHPDWFYWIRREFADEIKPFHIEGHPICKAPTLESARFIYNNERFKKYITYFTQSPDKLNPEKWLNLSNNFGNRNIIKEIEEVFGIVVPPAFSDCANDPQPPWSDVTFFKFYSDIPEYAKKYLPGDTVPYLFHDTAKASNLPGSKPVEELWKYVTNIIPYWVKEFGFDGVRPDMAHALPIELGENIIKKARDAYDDFCFFAEELDINNSENIRKQGNNIMVGDLFWRLEPDSNKMEEYITKTNDEKTLFLGAAEIPDTLRIARFGKDYAKEAFKFILTLKNVLPFCLNGQELLETQPMNFGLVSKEEQIDYLPETDPWFGKLAFYDKVAMHWDNPNAFEMYDFIRNLIKQK